MTIPTPQWVYRAQMERVVDGDTFVARLDLGLGVQLGRGNEGAHLRLLGVDTPERNEPGWAAARDYTAAWLAHDQETRWPLVVRTTKADAFGRYLAEVWRSTDGRCLNDDLLVAGHARPRV